MRLTFLGISLIHFFPATLGSKLLSEIISCVEAEHSTTFLLFSYVLLLLLGVSSVSGGYTTYLAFGATGSESDTAYESNNQFPQYVFRMRFSQSLHHPSLY